MSVVLLVCQPTSGPLRRLPSTFDASMVSEWDTDRRKESGNYEMWEWAPDWPQEREEDHNNTRRSPDGWDHLPASVFLDKMDGKEMASDAVRGDPVLQLMASACAGDELLGWFRCRSLWFQSNICYFPSSKDGNYNSFFIIKKMLLQHLQYEFFFHVSTSINFEYYFVSIKCRNYSLIAL